jgi:hypothetical protein
MQGKRRAQMIDPTPHQDNDEVDDDEDEEDDIPLLDNMIDSIISAVNDR